MKNIIIKLTLNFVLLFAYMQISASEIQLRIPDTTGIVDNFIDVPVYVDSSLTGLGVYSYELLIDYTESRLEPLGFIITGTLSENWNIPFSFVNNGIISIANAGATPLEGTGPLFYIRFNMINSGTGYINFSGGTQSNFFNEGDPPMILDNGYVSISALPTINLYPDDALITEGEQKQFNVSGGTAPYTWSVTNPAVATIDANGLLTGTDQGFTQVVVEDDNGITDVTTGFVEVRLAKLYIEPASAYQGALVDVPVYITDVTGEGIVSGSFSLSFGEQYLEAIGFDKTGTLLETYTDPAINIFPGGINLSFAGTTPLTGSGVLVYISFQVSNTQTYGTNITPNNVLFNETLPGATQYGFFDVIPLPVLVVSPNTAELVASEILLFSVSGATPPVTWSSSDPGIASIDPVTGILTAHQSGVIQVKALDGIGATGTSGNIQVYDTYVIIANGYPPFGTVYDLPVTIGNLPAGQEIFSMQGKISFETPELELIDIITTGTLSQGWAKSQFSTGNSVTFAIAGPASFNTSGTLFFLRFQLTNDLTINEHAWVNFDNFTLNEGIPFPKLLNGGITATAGVPATQNLSMTAGWGGISSYVVPDNSNIEVLFAPATGMLDILYDKDGNIYQPGWGVNTIGNWDTQKGYVIKLSGPAVVEFDGLMNFNKTISVSAGWNLIPVISDCPVAVGLLNAAIGGLTIVQEVAGTGLYWPVMGINTIGDLQPGKAYYLHTSVAGSFTYPICPK